jgi:hypothetical protein
MREGGDNGAALAFLRWLRPHGLWVLTAIAPDRKTIDTATFDEASIDELAAWLTANNGVRNVYFMLNPPRGSISKKASKEDVEAMAFLHVDCDPPKGADITASRAEILARLRAFKPAPSAIIDSGGGYQGFWRLDEPLYVGGNVARAEECEAYNVQLETLLKGDHCFNCDRVLRLPGTWNLPDEKKRAAGRTERVASVVGDLTALSYPLEAFTPAPRLQSSNGSSLGSAPRVQIAGNLSPVLVDDLPETVGGRIKMLIVQGLDPDDPSRYSSRSEVSWAVTCGLVRAGCDDNTIASILLDPDYAVSAHVLAQRRSSEYVARQIQRAREEVEEPMLRFLNEKHAVIEDMGGKCRIISETLDFSVKPPRPRVSKQSFDDFRNRYMNKRVQVGKNDKGEPIWKAAGAWWLGHPLRRQYTSLVFSPEHEVEGAYNLWKGFSCEAIPGKNHEPWLEHLRENICGGNLVWYEYLIRWMARGVQHPGSQGEVSVVMRGGRGTGKGTVATVYGSLWGRHWLHLSSAKHLVGNFNSHLRDAVFVYADEAFFAGDKSHESVLKTLITEDTIMVEPKGVDAELCPNYVHLILSSNQDWVIPAGADERRFFVLEVGEGKKQDLAYFGAMREALKNGGRESLLHFLLTLDLSNFEVRDIPPTGALQAQKVYSMGLEESWWFERLVDGNTTRAASGWSRSLLKDALYADYLGFAESQRSFRRATPTALGMFLSKMMPGKYPIGVQRMTTMEQADEYGRPETVQKRRYFYDIPSLSELRAFWETRFGAQEWPAEENNFDPQRDPQEPY